MNSVSVGKLRETCRAFVATHFAYELEGFDCVWDALAQIVKLESKESAVLGWQFADSPIRRLGGVDRPIAHDSDILAALSTLLSSTAILTQASRDANLTWELISKTLRTESERLCTPTHVRGIIAQWGPTLLGRLFGLEDSDAPQAPTEDRTPRARNVYILRRVNHRMRKQGGPYPQRVRQEARQNALYNIVVDEFRHEIDWRATQSSRPRIELIDNVPRRSLGMLWLTLVHHADYVSNDMVKQLFSISENSDVNRIKNDYASYLTGVAPGLLILGSKTHAGYPVSQDFNFCWLLRAMDTRQSELHYRVVGQPPEKS